MLGRSGRDHKKQVFLQGFSLNFQLQETPVDLVQLFHTCAEGLVGDYVLAVLEGPDRHVAAITEDRPYGDDLALDGGQHFIDGSVVDLDPGCFSSFLEVFIRLASTSDLKMVGFSNGPVEAVDVGVAETRLPH